MKWLGLLASVLAVFLATSNADAALTLRLTDDTTLATFDVVVSDGDPADLNTATGAVTISASFGSWVVNVTTGISKPLIGPAELDLNSVNVTGGAGGTLFIELTDTGYSVGDGSFGWITNFGGTTDGTVVAKAWVDDGDVAFAQTTLVSGPLTFTATDPDDSFSFVDVGATGSITGTFSSTIQVKITHSGGGQNTSFDLDTRLPEPATMLLLGLGLTTLGVAGARRRNRR